jgi:hypothetical protein
MTLQMMASLNRWLLATVLVVACIAACSAPTQSDVLGLWRGTGETRLEFRQDGTFVGRSLPGSVFFGRSDLGAAMNGSGTWRLEQSHGRWLLRLSFERSQALPQGYDTQVYVSGSGQRTALFVTIGDPDSGERYELIR